MASMRATGPMKADTARRIRRTAELVDHHHPETVTGGHLRDAAKMISIGHTDAAKRHLDAAMEVLTPRNLIRHGITDDEGHATAKHHMHEINRHRLAVMDIEDVRGRNDDLREKARQTTAARLGGPGSGVNDTGTQPGPPQQAARTYSTWAEVERAIELAFWNREPRLPTGEWTSVRGDSAAAMHGRMVHGLTGKGAVITGIYNHARGTVTGRHMGRSPVVRVKLTANSPAPVKGISEHRMPAIAFSHQVELAFPLMDWMNEARDPSSGKWVSGPATLGDVRRHLATTHSMGQHPEMSAEQMLAWHSKIHQELPQAQNHHHIVRGGGASSEYGRARAARDAQAALTSPAFSLTEQGAMGLRGPKRNARGKVMGYSSWDQVLQAIELSARTGMLSVTPAPRGKPGGPGLYHVKGMGHTPYLQQIVKALIEKRGMPSGKAYAIARASIRKWSRGGAHAHPEVVAAAGRAEAGEVARQARAHSHTAGPGRAVELAAVAGGGGGGAAQSRAASSGQRQRSQAQVNQPRVPAGQMGGGRFGSGGGGQKDPNAGKGMAGKTAGSRARLVQRAKLQNKAAGIRGQIKALLAQLPQTRKPASKAAATKAAKAQSPAAAAAAAKSATRAKSATSTPRKKSLSPATIHAKINALRAELAGIEAQIKAL